MQAFETCKARVREPSRLQFPDTPQARRCYFKVLNLLSMWNDSGFLDGFLYTFGCFFTANMIVDTEAM